MSEISTQAYDLEMATPLSEFEKEKVSVPVIFLQDTYNLNQQMFKKRLSANLRLNLLL